METDEIAAEEGSAGKAQYRWKRFNQQKKTEMVPAGGIEPTA
jgi:hypothetical protein